MHHFTVASLRVTGTRVHHNMAGVAPARSARSHGSIAGVVCRADGCLRSDGRARSESVSASCAMVGWALSLGLIDLPFSHWTHVTFKHERPPVTFHSPRATWSARLGPPGFVFKHPSRMGKLELNLIVTSLQMTVFPSSPAAQPGDN